jgi:predicted O-linked N-acetylglucosamine transferase (SPINDLY family)
MSETPVARQAVLDLLQRAIAQQKLGNLSAAEAACAQALALAPRDKGALHLAGVLALHNGNARGAVRFLQRAIEVERDAAELHVALGLALEASGEPTAALRAYDQAIATAAVTAEVWSIRGNVLLGQRRYAEARSSYDQAVALDPRNAGYRNNRAAAMLGLRQLEDSLAESDAALALDPNVAEAHNNRGNALRELRRLDDALRAYDTAAALKPALVEAHVNVGNTALRLGLLDRAVEALGSAVSRAPLFPFAKGYWLHAKSLCCDWNAFTQLRADIDRGVAAGEAIADPFGYQAVATSPRLLKAAAEIFASRLYPPRPSIESMASAGPARDKIRLGYLCGEFRNQATSILMAEVYELHDTDRFDVFAFDNGWDDGSDLRRRLNSAFREMVDISKADDATAARAIAGRNIDILVNLNGYFGDNRQGVFAHRPAPIQVNYLGFPGTLGAPYIDYILADEIVLPPEDHGHYTEKVVTLPDCYQPNDRKRAIAARVFSRADLGLPDHGTIFCCFNNSYKILPDVFDVWIDILKRTPASVLWLLADNAAAARNLRHEAERRGIASSRLVFADRIGHAEHLARHRVADLFLDTWPYNAHTTASDALWAGLPVVTCKGTTFPGRVAASLLHAIGLPELIADSPRAYENLAVALATNAAELRRLREKLAKNRDRCALFDAPRLTRSLEAAYIEMRDRHGAGLPPAPFRVGTAP